MPKIERSITINAPAKKVFEYIADPKLIPEWLPGMIEVKDINQTEEGVGSTYKFAYKVAGMRFEGEDIVEEYIPNKKMVTKSKGSVESSWTWNFEPYNDKTKVEVIVEYKVPIPVLGKIAEALVLKQTEREADHALANIKDKMEG
jgi:uncharacterized membrane protein